MAVDKSFSLVSILPMEVDMQTAFPSYQSKFKSLNHSAFNDGRPNGFFHNHSLGEVVRSVFFSSVLWMVLAVALYGVYTMVVGNV
jgi:hypothetical protein